MPETAVYEDEFSASRENKIGAAGQVANVEAVTEAQRMGEWADDHFRLRILAPNGGHATRTLFGRENVSHRPNLLFIVVMKSSTVRSFIPSTFG